MHMSFWFSSDVGDFLFSGYTITSPLGLFATCLGLSALFVIYEALKVCNARVKQQATEARLRSHQQTVNKNWNSETSALIWSGHNWKGKLHSMMWLFTQLVLYLSQEWVNWIIMMAVMSYNGYVFLSALVGAGIGYAIFGQNLMQIKLHNAKLKAASLSCGECVERSVDGKSVLAETLPGQSEPPTGSSSIQTIPARIYSVPDVTIHHCAQPGESAYD